MTISQERLLLNATAVFAIYLHSDSCYSVTQQVCYGIPSSNRAPSASLHVASLSVLPVCLLSYLPVSLSALPACLSACFPTCLSVCLSCLPVCLPDFLTTCHRSACLPTSLPTCISASQPAMPFISLLAFLTVCLPVCVNI